MGRTNYDSYLNHLVYEYRAEQPFIVRAYNAIDLLVVMNELPFVAAGCPPVYLVRN
jgi:hypothetical protein